MKRIFSVGCLLSLVLSIHAGESWHETRSVLSSGKQVLRPTESWSGKAKLLQPGTEVRRRLRVCGLLQIPPPLTKRGEEFFRRSECRVDDNLDSNTRKNDPFSLYFKGENENFERYAYYKIVPGEDLGQELTLSLPFVRTEKLKIAEKGHFDVRLEIYTAKAGRHPQDVYDQPDAIEKLGIQDGTYQDRSFSKSIRLPKNTVCILIRCGGEHFSGTCWLEAPKLQWGSKTFSQPFAKSTDWLHAKNGWVGINLATRSWPLWELTINGKPHFLGHCFDRASNVADFYIPLPATLQPEDSLKLTLKDEAPRTSFPYELRSVEILEERARAFELISMPKFVRPNSKAGLLVETNRKDVNLTVRASEGIQPRTQELHFAETGLHAIPFTLLPADSPRTAVSVEISDGSRTASATSTLIHKGNDEVYLSSGDEIYLNKTETDYPSFFKWYISQRIGNQYHFRPSYQWSGCREVGDAFARKYADLLAGLAVPYAWQVEGRTVAASRLNPSLEALDTPYFRGKQAHENDGCYYYWGHFVHKDVAEDICARTRPFGGIFAKARPIYRDYGNFVHYDKREVRDMAHGAKTFVSHLAYSRGKSTRHTGPSVLFRYLYQAGYEWLGAEQMYGPEPLILSALRGAAKAYTKRSFGSLHAMQWGSRPFTDPRHAHRFYLSLATAYMHGVSHINTEEALWTDEHLNDRFTVSGKEHLWAQHQVLDQIETHTRRGKLHSGIAVLQGRNDGWKSFGRGPVWSQDGEKWKFNDACESFDLLQIFYPECKVNVAGPDGWFTRTPYGPIDILPIEAREDVLNEYDTLIFLGWNTYDEADMQRLCNFVWQGGTLLLSAAHLNVELQPDLLPVFPEQDALIRSLLGEGYRVYTQRTERTYGKGRVIYFPQKCYPIAEELQAAYSAEIRRLAERNVQSEISRGWIAEGEKISFTPWDSADRRTLYLLNIDWQGDSVSRPATFLWEKQSYQLPVPRTHMIAIHCFDGLAVCPMGNTTDVLSAKREGGQWLVTVQAVAADQIRCMSRGEHREQIFPCQPGIHTFRF